MAAHAASSQSIVEQHQKYAQEHDLPAVFEALIVSLITAKPGNPFAHVAGEARRLSESKDYEPAPAGQEVDTEAAANSYLADNKVPEILEVRAPRAPSLLACRARGITRGTRPRVRCTQPTSLPAHCAPSYSRPPPPATPACPSGAVCVSVVSQACQPAGLHHEGVRAVAAAEGPAGACLARAAVWRATRPCEEAARC
jgi:hypothetical protein